MRTIIYGVVDPRTQELRYVGKTVHKLSYRMSQHRYEALHKKGNHRRHWMRQVLESGHQLDAFVIEEVEGTGAEEEVHHIAQFRSIGCDLVNATAGGEGVQTPSEETRRKMRAAQLGRRASEETKEKLRVSHLGKKHSAEQRAKNSASQLARWTDEKRAAHGELSRGRKDSIETRAKKSKARTGIKLSEETRAKIGAAFRGKPQSPESVEKRMRKRRMRKMMRQLVALLRGHYAALCS